MRSQIFASVFLGAASLVAAAPLEARAPIDQVLLQNAAFVRADSNGNDNWDTLTYAGFDLTTTSGKLRCTANDFPTPSVPSNVYECSDASYSFQITERPAYGKYTFEISHEVEGQVLKGTTSVGCNGPIPLSCSQVGSNSLALTAA
ncbi:hypothetical protein EJ04DRAFT_517491 [Polyplosphaeria fusca]|uniref:AA1-like domain-containing protein n=1 Tax=Polyplosphaeria fusca TaxID=682080 RepID=A0A9P4QGW5_9PLEO|nr:hypothetical protein EJ04DRAFT_517491 [Polyplosphaeria fusca]